MLLARATRIGTTVGDRPTCLERTPVDPFRVKALAAQLIKIEIGFTTDLWRSDLSNEEALRLCIYDMNSITQSSVGFRRSKPKEAPFKLRSLRR
ncbi:hypothetical protein GCM10010981_23270 [Dyella nitratireducens]|uniref:Uncharacterized protein n=1 Tax=Dyella nitratireducens TaxID=1849580 RepID=A0ABQ1FYG5_9GAMM|nr:hypothetical protein GCM10010981_23270 [Dyella nitratireducens]GLQ40761.1 hypothetical protein GCM10007902_06110 [Dyella nitratireducens]